MFKIRGNSMWNDAFNYGASTKGYKLPLNTEYKLTLGAGSQDMAVPAAGTYDIWFNADKKIIYAMTPGKTPADVSGWAIWAQTGEEWEQIEMLKTTVSNLFVTKGVKLEAYKSFLVKASANWNTKYGTGSVDYIKANKCFTAVKDGVNITVEAAGTYDIYFNSNTKKVYLMTAGTAYNSATEASPVLLFKPNSNWYGNSKRCSAYFYNKSGNT